MDEACVSLVAVSGRPLRIVDHPGMRMLLDPVIKGLRKSFSISSETVVEYIKNEATLLREVLKKKVGNRFICPTVDCAKRLPRSIVGINIKFIED